MTCALYSLPGELVWRFHKVGTKVPRTSMGLYLIGDGRQATVMAIGDRVVFVRFVNAFIVPDNTSGEALSINFDDAIVTAPILYGEYFPLVRKEDVIKRRGKSRGKGEGDSAAAGIAAG